MKRALIGPRSTVRRTVPEVIDQAKLCISKALELCVVDGLTIFEVKERFSEACVAYYSLAAASRRSQISDSDQAAAFSILFWVRSNLETAILPHISAARDIEAAAFTDSFFGRSSKQGVSLRYPLSSCVPTKDCGARCYAHDGRDRDIHLIFRGVLNYWVGSNYELASQEEKQRLMGRLDPLIRKAIQSAKDEAANSASSGFERAARIRFSHVGELAATPHFANSLAERVKMLEPTMECVAYTRHPQAKLLDPRYFNVNFTLESPDDPRMRFAPEHSRIVGSAWDGVLIANAEINFLEHHVQKHFKSPGGSTICPVTINPKATPSCDSARCEACFVSPSGTIPLRIIKKI